LSAIESGELSDELDEFDELDSAEPSSELVTPSGEPASRSGFYPRPHDGIPSAHVLDGSVDFGWVTGQEMIPRSDPDR
jgi:hypothetical protein